MKFYAKIFLSMFILVSVSFGIFGTLLIQNSFQSSLDKEIEIGKTENQMLKLTFETTANSIPEAYFESQRSVLKKMAQSIEKRMNTSENGILLVDQDNIQIYANQKIEFDTILFEQISPDKSGYRIYKSQDNYYLNVMSIIDSRFSTHKIWLQTTTDITSIYTERQQMFQTYRMIMMVMLACVSVVVFVVSYFLTKSVRQLSKVARNFAKGDMEARARVKSKDEISVLATDFNEMADKLTNRIITLEEQARRQEDFTSAFAHELKTPLTSIIGYADMIRSMDLQEEERVKAAGYIYSQGKRLESLSFKLLDLFVLKRQDFEFVTLDAHYFIQNVFDLAEVGVLEKNLVLKMSAERGTIFGEKDLLISLFANLIDNAKKASEDGNTIWIEGKSLEDGYEIAVKDEGRGIPKQEFSRITEAFYMVDKSRSRKEGGAGLGLTLCSHIVNLHGAEWKIESEEGKGTCITVRFGKEEEK